MSRITVLIASVTTVGHPCSADNRATQAAVMLTTASGKAAGGADGSVKTVTTKQTIDTADITY